MCYTGVIDWRLINQFWWSHGLHPARLFCPWNSPGKNTGVGCHAHLQGIFPTQGSNLGLPHCRQIPSCLSHQGSPMVKLKRGLLFIIRRIWGSLLNQWEAEKQAWNTSRTMKTGEQRISQMCHRKSLVTRPVLLLLPLASVGTMLAGDHPGLLDLLPLLVLHYWWKSLTVLHLCITQ